MPPRRTTAEFIELAHKAHADDDKYLYDRVIYVNAKTEVTIGCPDHDYFPQLPDVHLRPAGCKKCGAKKVGESNSRKLKGRIGKRYQGATKICGRCRKEKPNNFDYFTVITARNGDKVTGSYCRDCKRKESAKDSKLADMQREQRVLAAVGLRKCRRCGEIKEITGEHFYFNTASNLYSSNCKLCRSSGRYREINQLLDKGLIKCTGCNKILPADDEHFFKSSITRSGFVHCCKSCTQAKTSPKYAEKLNLAEQGFKKCVACSSVKRLEKFHTGAGVGGRGSYCIDCENIRQKKWRTENAEQFRERSRQYRQRNSHIYRANKIDRARAFPSWLSDQQKTDMRAIYQEAELLTCLTGVPHEVDHIVPIKGDAVCGLHVPWNIEAVPRNTNRRKSNRVDLDEVSDRMMFELLGSNP